jgi:tRNA(fMet)-specific endonuclease VapC
MKILESDHCVAILRGKLDLAGRAAPDEELAITAVSVGELAHGAARSQRAADNLARLDVLLAALTVLSYDEWAARRFGQLKAQLEQAGESLDDLDLQIASIALEHAAVLVTHNQKHFGRLAGMAGLALEDWLG